ncbi:MAG: NADH-quinone oxidoreductase subunit NuoE [Thermodesulfovibrionales bacterium]
MFTEEERKEIEELIREAGGPRAAATDALRAVQRRRGWVSDEMGELAAMLGMTTAELDSIATFYSLIYRKPVGKHVILICDSISCWINGHEEILAHLMSRLGVGLGCTTADGQFTLLPAACLGVCEKAPAMMVDEELHTELTEEKVDDILERYGRG